jgi:hypothetical protein
MRSYWKASQSPAYNYFLGIGLLVGYEGLIRLAPAGASVGRNLIDLWVQWVFHRVAPYHWVLSLGVVLLGLAYVYLIRRDRGTLYAWVFGLMLVESAVWAYGVWRFLPMLMQQVAAPAAQLSLPSETLHALALCMGAGFYEELFFRVLLVEGLIWVFTGLRYQKAHSGHIIASWIVSAGVFSALHFVHEPFSWYAFWYRGAFGLVMSGLYLVRGFGIAAWTHALYDVAVLWL